MNTVYYVEINLICIILLFLFCSFSPKGTRQSSSLDIVFRRIVVTTIVLCASDMIAGVFRGAMFPGARTIISVSNWICFQALAVISYFWAKYVVLYTNDSSYFGKREYVLVAPLVIYTLISVTNAVTGFLFVIDENNLYVRGNGVIFHWIITWGYFLFATYKTARAYIREKSALRRQKIKPLICFFIAPMVASAVQMMFYGVSSTQVGVTLSIIMIYIARQSESVLADPLTGLNNRRGMDNYLNRYLENNSEQPIRVSMIDVNGFKGINDRYGHVVGDQVLTEIANALRHICQNTANNVFLCRYGGDEFLIAEIADNKASSVPLDQEIHKAVNALENKLPCPVSVSIGSALGVCDTADAVKAQLSEADRSMYKEKANCKIHSAS